MATPKQSGLSPLAMVEGEEEQQKFAEVQQLQQQLKDALDYRKGFYLDPMMLALAQGFATPTKTGSFFESAGIAAGRAAEAQEAERKRAQEIAQMRLEIAMGELGLQQQQRTARDLSKFLGGAPAGAQPGAQAAPSGEGRAQAAPQAGGMPADPNVGARPLTEETVARIKMANPNAGKVLEDLMKSKRDRYAISMQGIVFDKDTGQYLNLPIPGQKQESFETPFGKFMMTPYEYDQMQRAIAAGKGKEWMQSWRGGVGAAAVGAPSAAPSDAQQAVAGAQKPSGRRTQAEIEAEAKAQETKAIETAKAEVGRTQAAIGLGEDVNSRLATYSTLEAIARRKGSEKILGILATPDVSSALIKLVETGIQIPGFSISLPDIQNALRNVNIPKELISDAQIAATMIAQAQLQASKIMSGQGAVSNFERQLFGTASFSMEDRPETILKKVGMLRARAELDREVAKALRKSKMDLDEFKDSDQYDRLIQSYHAKLSNIVSPQGSTRPGGTLHRKLGIPEKG